MVLMGSTILLVILTLLKGFKIEDNVFFLLLETLINLFILADFIFRIRLMGAKRFF